MLQDEYKRVYTAWDHIQEDSKSYTRDKRRDNRIKLVEAEEPDRDTRKEADTMVFEVWPSEQTGDCIQICNRSFGTQYRSTEDHHSTESGAAHRTGQSADDLLPVISGLYRTWQSRKPRERLVWTIYLWRGVELNLSVYAAIGQHLFLIEESKEAAGEKEEASYIGDNIRKCDHRITGLCSRRKHLFYRDNQSSRIISLPERDRKRGQEQIRKKNTDKIIWTGGERGQQVDGGTYNWEEPFYLLYSLNVVHFYTDQKFKFDIDKSRK